MPDTHPAPLILLPFDTIPVLFLEKLTVSFSRFGILSHGCAGDARRWVIERLLRKYIQSDDAPIKNIAEVYACVTASDMWALLWNSITKQNILDVLENVKKVLFYAYKAAFIQEVPERFFWHTTVSHAPTDTIWPAHRTFDSIAPSAAIIPYVIHALQCYHHLAL